MKYVRPTLCRKRLQPLRSVLFRRGTRCQSFTLRTLRHDRWIFAEIPPSRFWRTRQTGGGPTVLFRVQLRYDLGPPFALHALLSTPVLSLFTKPCATRRATTFFLYQASERLNRDRLMTSDEQMFAHISRAAHDAFKWVRTGTGRGRSRAEIPLRGGGYVSPGHSLLLTRAVLHPHASIRPCFVEKGIIPGVHPRRQKTAILKSRYAMTWTREAGKVRVLTSCRCCASIRSLARVGPRCLLHPPWPHRGTRNWERVPAFRPAGHPGHVSNALPG